MNKTSRIDNNQVVNLGVMKGLRVTFLYSPSNASIKIEEKENRGKSSNY